MIIQSKNIWICSQFISAQLEINEGKITGIYDYNEYNADIDYDDKWILPGFIDVHTHGGYDYDTNDADTEGLRRWMQNAPKEGITSIVPTTITQDKEVLKKALKVVAEVKNSDYTGSEIAGIHLEGPYLSKDKAGAQPTEYIVNATTEEFKEYQNAADNLIKVITIAPEADKNYKLTKYCADNHVKVNIGHSTADYQDTLMAISNGASGITHIFNTTTRFHHRDLGLVNLAMISNAVYCEVIGDGIHVDYKAVNALFKAKKDSIMMITDSLLLKGSSNKTAMFGGNEIIKKEKGGAMMGFDNSILAGSTLEFNKGFKNLITKAMVPFEDALNACTKTPAEYIGLGNNKGKIKYGYDADLVIMNQDYQVIETYCKGKTVYRKVEEK